jgi:steroid delta-isomerase-like uncharacterized protein
MRAPVSQPVAKPATAVTFVVRFWRETSAREARWRGRIEHVQSREGVSFLDPEGMLQFIRKFGIATGIEGDFAMSLQENKVLVQRFVQQVQNQHDLDALDEIFSPDFVDFGGMSKPPTREGARNLFIELNTAFPDARFEIHRQLAESDKVVTHKTFHGTHRGSFMSIPPTGKGVSFDVIDILTVSGGMITEHWTVSDMLGLMQQLGVVTAPA